MLRRGIPLNELLGAGIVGLAGRRLMMQNEKPSPIVANVCGTALCNIRCFRISAIRMCNVRQNRGVLGGLHVVPFFQDHVLPAGARANGRDGAYAIKDPCWVWKNHE